MFIHIDFARPAEHIGVVLLEHVQHTAVVLGLLQVGGREGGDQVDLLAERLVLVLAEEVLGVLNVIYGVWRDGVVESSAVKVVAAVWAVGVLLHELLPNAQHGGEQDPVVLHPLHVGVPGNGGPEERPGRETQYCITGRCIKLPEGVL